MPQIGVLVTGAGVNTSLSNLPEVDNYLYLGDVDTAMPLRGIKVAIGGRTTIDIQTSQPLCSVLAKFMQKVSGAVVGLVFKLASGKVREKTTITLTNDGATTPVIRAFSDADNGKPVRANTVGLNALSSQVFDRFTGLFFTPIASIGSVDITFRKKDGSLYTQPGMTAEDLDTLYAFKNETEANGRLDAAVAGIDNTDQTVHSVRVTAAAALTVMVVNFDEADFKVLQVEASKM
jgi:hypothetical protein